MSEDESLYLFDLLILYFTCFTGVVVERLVLTEVPRDDIFVGFCGEEMGEVKRRRKEREFATSTLCKSQLLNQRKQLGFIN